MVDESLILTIKLKDEVTSSIKNINTSLDGIESKVSNINKLALASTITQTFKNAFDAIEKMNKNVATYEKQLVQVEEKERNLSKLKKDLVEIQNALNEEHDPKLYEKYKETLEKIKIEEEKLKIEKRKLFNAQLNLITSTMQLATTTIPNLVASFSALSSTLGALRVAINATFFTNPIGLAIVGITSGVLALNEILGFLPFKISDAFNFSKVGEATTKIDDITNKIDEFNTKVDDAKSKVKALGEEIKTLSMDEIKLEFNKDLGIDNIGSKFFKNVMDDAKRRIMISNPTYFIDEILNSEQFTKALGMVKGGIIPLRTLEANVMQTLIEMGLPQGLEESTRLKVQIVLKERINTLTSENNTKLDEQTNIYKKLNNEVINVNKSLDKFIDKIATLRREIARMEEEWRSRPQPLSITITPSSGGGGSVGKTSTISPYPSRPPQFNTIENVGNRITQKNFTSGMYVY